MIDFNYNDKTNEPPLWLHAFALFSKSNPFIHEEIDRSIDEQTQELRKVFIPSQEFDHKQQAEELCTIRTGKSTSKEQKLTEIIATPRTKYPKLAPKEIVELGDKISRYVRPQIVTAQYPHHHPYHKGGDEGIERTH